MSIFEASTPYTRVRETLDGRRTPSSRSRNTDTGAEHFRARRATLIARFDVKGLKAPAVAPGGDRNLHQSTRRGLLGDPDGLGTADAARRGLSLVLSTREAYRQCHAPANHGGIAPLVCSASYR